MYTVASDFGAYPVSSDSSLVCTLSAGRGQHEQHRRQLRDRVAVHGHLTAAHRQQHVRHVHRVVADRVRRQHAQTSADRP